jgi:ABC-type lipoprotein export system ATPase subunit
LYCEQCAETASTTRTGRISSGEPKLNHTSFLSPGSTWHRWDPHVHLPDTLLANQYKGAHPWDDFVSLIEAASPPIEALGITDYWNIHGYSQLLELKQQGRLPNVGLIFPNVELRLDIRTAKSAGINLHLLFSPEDPKHIAEIERFLSRLEFTYLRQPYPCTRAGLAQLGRAFDNTITDEGAALRAGANQFKVSFAELQKRWHEDPWAQANGLIAVSGSSNDGTAGLGQDDSFRATREEVEGFAHIVFASQPSQRDFWLGRGLITREELEQKRGGLKPCLHGSDAHTQGRIGIVYDDRYTWIKGDLTFESLRQACIEPENRAIVSARPPTGALPSNVITEVAVTNAAWLPQTRIPLNPGIVAIIGARGSGKTALADLIAAGANAVSRTDSRSFIRRAHHLLHGAKTQLTWQSGPQTSGDLDRIPDDDEWNGEPQVQYLSQQFVDQLCSAEGLADSLLVEIERVIFDAHQISDRMGTHSFQQLLGIRTESAKRDREVAEYELTDIASELAEERVRKTTQATLTSQRKEKEDVVIKTRSDRAEMIGKGKSAYVEQFNALRDAVEEKRREVGVLKQSLRAVYGLRKDLDSLRVRTIPAILQRTKDLWCEAGLTEQEWSQFQMEYSGDIYGTLDAKAILIEKLMSELEGPPEKLSISAATAPLEPAETFLPQGMPLQKVQLRTLERELKRLTALLTADDANARKLSTISERLSREEGDLEILDGKILRAAAADENISLLQARRTNSYRDLIDAIIQEENELNALYQPLAERLKGETGSLGKLSFYVKRDVDLARWAERGENLLDLRKASDFKGKGSLYRAAADLLLGPWTNGSADDAANAMASFREAYDESFREYGKVNKADRDAYLDWTQNIAEWLYSADHIRVAYDLQYDGVKVDQLSPGTRGIVLLLLYLAVDAEDTRPLIIDQPEENLDPQSVVRDLVSRFRDARSRRQIIIVTHNANLVVNTDVDQVIVASSGAHRSGELPVIQYHSGGLEDPQIRRSVCDILEGGDKAFRERARRLRIDLPRG